MGLAKNQDFESYAVYKPFKLGVNPVWIDVFKRLASRSGKEIAEIKVLDFGCGDGKYYYEMQEIGVLASNISGTEVSEIRIKRCHDFGWANAVYLPLHAPLPFSDHQFDIVQMVEVIEHIPSSEIDFYLGEIKRVLKPNGYIIATTPNYPVKRFQDFYDAFVKKRWNRIKDDPTHVALYNPTTLKNKISSFFKEAEVECYKRGYLYSKFKKPIFMHKLIVSGRA